MKTMPAIANLIARGAVLIAGIALAIILLLIGGQIASRIFAGESLSWSDELARLFFIYLVFIGAAEASMRRTHISVDLQDTFGVSPATDRIIDLARLIAELLPDCRIEQAPDAGRDLRSYRVDCSKAMAGLPGFAPEWTLRYGLQDLIDRFSGVRPGPDLFEGARFSRIAQLKALLNEGRLDDGFRWVVDF